MITQRSVAHPPLSAYNPRLSQLELTILRVRSVPPPPALSWLPLALSSPPPTLSFITSATFTPLAPPPRLYLPRLHPHPPPHTRHMPALVTSCHSTIAHLLLFSSPLSLCFSSPRNCPSAFTLLLSSLSPFSSHPPLCSSVSHIPICRPSSHISLSTFPLLIFSSPPPFSFHFLLYFPSPHISFSTSRLLTSSLPPCFSHLLFLLSPHILFTSLLLTSSSLPPLSWHLPLYLPSPHIFLSTSPLLTSPSLPPLSSHLSLYLPSPHILLSTSPFLAFMCPFLDELPTRTIFSPLQTVILNNNYLLTLSNFSDEQLLSLVIHSSFIHSLPPPPFSYFPFTHIITLPLTPLSPFFSSSSSRTSTHTLPSFLSPRAHILPLSPLSPPHTFWP